MLRDDSLHIKIVTLLFSFKKFYSQTLINYYIIIQFVIIVFTLLLNLYSLIQFIK